MAHIRRKFEHALPYDKPNGFHVPGLVKQHNAIERAAREGEMDANQRLALRKKKATPLV